MGGKFYRLLVATVTTGHTNHITPGMAGCSVEHCHPYGWFYTFVHIQLNWASLDTSKTKGASGLPK